MAEHFKVRGGVPTFVYEIFDAEDRLLYVGVTQSLKQRLSGHRATKPWWGEVSYVQRTSYDTRAAAIAAEAEAIRSGDPKYNVTHLTINLKAEPAQKLRPTTPDAAPAIRVQAHRREGGWELHIDGEPVTQVGTLDGAVQQYRDYLDTKEPDRGHDTERVIIVPVLGDLDAEVSAVRTGAAIAASAWAMAEMRLQRTARRLHDLGYSAADCATLLDVPRNQVDGYIQPQEKRAT